MDRVVADTYFLGIDIGTQSVRAFAVTPTGEVLARGAVALSSSRHGVLHEQDPTEWWFATVRAVNVVTRELPDVTVRAVACCGTSGTVLFRTPDGQAVTSVLMYDDERAPAVTLRRLDGSTARVPPSWGLAKARWLLREHQLPSDARLAHQVDVLTFQLTGGVTATDWSSALKSGADPTTGTWADGLPLPVQRLPEVVAPGTPIGRVSDLAAEATGIPAGTPVLAGLTDGCAAQVAAGALRAGSWNLVFGTTFVLKGCTAERLEDPTGQIYSHRSPDGSWWPGRASAAGHGALGALLDRPLDFEAMDAAAAALAERLSPSLPLCDPVVAEPRLVEAESGRALDPATDVEPAASYLAVQLGTAFLARRWLERVAELGADITGAIGLTGGAVRSPFFRQLIADVLGREVRVPAIAEGAVGMAVLAAASGSGEYGSLAEAADAMVRIEQHCGPTNPGRWDELYERWLSFFDPIPPPP